MSDSSIDDELFCNNADTDIRDMPKFVRYPSYYYTDEFRDYVEKHKIQVDKNHGYSFI